MQRLWSFLVLVVVLLIPTGCASTTGLLRGLDKPVQSPSVYSAGAQAVARQPIAQVSPVAVQPTHNSAVPLGHASTQQIALILPLQSASFGRAAKAVKDGFMAALAQQGNSDRPVTVKIYPTRDPAAESLAAYRQAQEEGCQLVVGPLTRDAVNALATNGHLDIPVLSLNVLDDETKSLPPNLYLFGLPLEDESRQVARLAYSDGLRTADIVYAPTALAERMKKAFSDEWLSLGGQLVREQPFTVSKAGIANLAESEDTTPVDMVFLAAGAAKGRLVRPLLSNDVPIYATSQIYAYRYAPQLNFGLNGIRFIDMPWLLQPDHAAVMLYARPNDKTTPEMARLYALGIDAFRLATELLGLSAKPVQPLDGVTGKIRLTTERKFVRELTEATFRQGHAEAMARP
ncbi:MAG: penicillin-binding protein activator [Burkholderiales bacterium]